MAQIVTTTEQSDKLLSLGIDPKTADMSYNYGRIMVVSYFEWSKEMRKEVIPAWSLGALFELMPQEIVRLDVCFLSIDRESIAYLGDDNQRLVMESKDIFQNAVDMIELLVNHGYIQSNLNKND